MISVNSHYPIYNSEKSWICSNFKFKYLRRIAIIGPESTGKTWLTQKLAAHFHEPFVPEYARFYLSKNGSDYEKNDLLKIAKGQLALEDKKASDSNVFLFCDTNLIVLKVWSDFKFGETDPWILEKLESRKYDHYLLTHIDLPWEYDPLREHPNHQRELFEIYKNYLLTRKFSYSEVSGIGMSRFELAKTQIHKHFSF